MAVLVQKCKAQAITPGCKLKPLGLMLALLGTLTLSACQTLPATTTSSTQGANRVTASQVDLPRAEDSAYEVDDSIDYDYPIEPYIPPAQTPSPTYPVPTAPKTNPVIIPPAPGDYTNKNTDANTGITAPPMPSRNELLQRARQNSQQPSQPSGSNQSDLPAFRNLMQTGTNQLRAGDLTAAENSFTRAQRLAPRSSAVYFYLSQVALKKNQPRKAEAMARRGLSVSEDDSRRQALWQLILQSAQLQNNTRVIDEARRALR